MPDTTIFGGLDPELTRRVVSRREALLRTGKMAGAVAVASMPLAFGVMAKEAVAQGGLPQGVIDVLNFALTLEYLEDDFYRTAVETSAVIPPTDLPVFQQISKHEAAHVALLQGVLGASAVARPAFDFTAGGLFDPFADYGQFLALSQGFEDTGVRAYKGQAASLITEDAVLQTALQIHSVEARHAAEVRRLRGLRGWITGADSDVPALLPIYVGEENTTQGAVNVAQFGTAEAASEAFDEPLSLDDVLAIANQFVVS
jgi:Ferritin-like domain